MGCNHQLLRTIGVEGIKPANSGWYQCNNKDCAQKFLVSIIASAPEDPEILRANRARVKISRHYIAADGTEHSSLQHAINQEAILKEVNEIHSLLLPRTEALNKGKGYIQQDLNQVIAAKERYVRLIGRNDSSFEEIEIGEGLSEELGEEPIFEENPFSEDPVDSLYERLKTIDEMGREWRSPKTARRTIENKKMVCLNPVDPGKPLTP